MTDTENLRALAHALTGEYELAGPWGWFGDTDHEPPYLATLHGGRMLVVGTDVRYDLHTMNDNGDGSTSREIDRYEAEDLGADHVSQTAQLTFPHRTEGVPYSVMTRADKMPVFEVAPQAVDASDPAVYRTQVRGLRNPVATYLAAVDPTTVLGLLDRIDELETQLRAT